jgi:16S rRNA (uracil1498-N3)-methyltransferase
MILASPSFDCHDMPPRFFSSAPLPRANFPAIYTLDAAAAQHVRVRRLSVGDALTLFDGAAVEPRGEAAAVITAIDKKSVAVEISMWRTRSAESPIDVSLIQALAVGDKMDLIVQKAVELGAAEIVPLRAARATLKLDAERAEKRVAHWNAVAISACEQCGRNRVPSVSDVQSLASALTRSGEQGRRTAILHPQGGISLSSWAAQAAQGTQVAQVAQAPGVPLALLIGPEGGFTDQEIDQAIAQGATKVTFGPRTLRTETAGLAALAAIQAILGDLR